MKNDKNNNNSNNNSYESSTYYRITVVLISFTSTDPICELYWIQF